MKYSHRYVLKYEEHLHATIVSKCGQNNLFVIYMSDSVHFNVKKCTSQTPFGTFLKTHNCMNNQLNSRVITVTRGKNVKAKYANLPALMKRTQEIVIKR